MAQRPISMFPGRSAMNTPRIPANMGNPGAGCLPLRALGGNLSLDKLESLELDAVEAEMMAADEKREADMGNLRDGCPIGMVLVEENPFQESRPCNYSRHNRGRGSARTERFTVHDGTEDESTNSDSSSEYSEGSFMDDSDERMETSQSSSNSIRSPDSLFNRTVRDSMELYVDSTSLSVSPEMENNSEQSAFRIDMGDEEVSGTLEDPETPLPPPSFAPIRRTEDAETIDVEGEPMELESHAVLDVTPEGQGTPLPSTSAPIRTLSTNPRRFRPIASPYVTPSPATATDEYSGRVRRVRFMTNVRTLRDADFEGSDDE